MEEKDKEEGSGTGSNSQTGDNGGGQTSGQQPKKRRMLLMEYNPPPKAENTAELPEGAQVFPHLSAGSEHHISTRGGIRYQKCGGGRRVLGKKRSD